MDEEGSSAFPDPVVDLRPARCWLDAFPWIEVCAVDSSAAIEQLPWWQHPIDELGTPGRELRLAQIAELALERLSRWTIGQIFPGLPSSIALADLPLPTRARNVLSRGNCYLAGDLQGEELSDILDWPQVGVGTVDSILRALADAATESASPVLTTRRERGRHRQASAPGAGGEPRETAIIRDLHVIANWYAALGQPGMPLLGGDLPVDAPTEVAEARHRLEQVTARDVFDHDRADLDVAELLQLSISALDERAQEILARRFFADHPETLEELGRSMGVTRERIRQIEGKARANMVEFLEPGDSLLEPLSTLGLVAGAVRDAVGTVTPLDELIARFPSLARRVKATAQPAWRVLDRLDDAYEIEDGWCAAPTIAGAQAVTLARLQESADAHGVVQLDDVEALNPRRTGGGPERFLGEWLTYCGYQLRGNHVFTRTSSVGDWAASILSAGGAPMASQEILDRIGVDRSLGSLKNAMGIDDRFERVDRDQWALASWGLDSYIGVRALVREEVARSDGRIALDDLVARITGKYSVTANSVVAYASSAPFRVKNGMVTLDTAGRCVRKTPERTRRLYRRRSAWVLRLKITKEHQRGSGFVAPMAVAGLLQMQPGETLMLDSELGPQSVNWNGNQPCFGSIRRFLVAADVAIDTEVFLVLRDDRVFEVEVIPTPTCEALADALTLVGAVGGDERQALVVLAAAIGLPEDSPASSVIGGYRERGDADIADLLLAARSELEGAVSVERPAVSADIDDIMDLL